MISFQLCYTSLEASDIKRPAYGIKKSVVSCITDFFDTLLVKQFKFIHPNKRITIPRTFARYFVYQSGKGFTWRIKEVYISFLIIKCKYPTFIKLVYSLFQTIFIRYILQPFYRNVVILNVPFASVCPNKHLVSPSGRIFHKTMYF